MVFTLASFSVKNSGSTTEQELSKLEETISNTGYYPYRTDQDGKRQLQEDPKKIDELFKKLMFDRLQRWIKLAEEKYRDTGIKCIITAGNDDLSEIEPISEFLRLRDKRGAQSHSAGRQS